MPQRQTAPRPRLFARYLQCLPASIFTRNLIILMLCLSWIVPHSASAQISVLDSLQSIIQNASDDAEAIRALNSFASRIRDRDIGACAIASEKAMELAELSNDALGLIESRLTLTTAQAMSGDYDSASRNAILALEASERRGYDRGMARALNSLALISENLNHFHQALSYLNQALPIVATLDSKLGNIIIHNNIADIYASLEDFDKALEYARLAEDLSAKANVRKLMPSILGIMSAAERGKGNLDAALALSRESLRIARETQDIPAKIYALRDVGLNLRGLGEDVSAFAHLHQSLRTALDYSYRGAIKDVYESLAESYEMHGDYVQALKYHKLYKAQSDSIFTELNARQLAAARTRMTFDNQERVLLEKDRQIQKLELERKTQLNQLLLGSLILIMALAGLLYHFYRQREGALRAQARQNLRLQEAVKIREQAQAALRESERMLQLVMNSIPQAIFWKNKDLKYIGCNNNFANDTGFADPQDIISKNDFELTWERERAKAFRERDRQILRSGVPEYHRIVPHKKPDGETGWIDLNKIPLHNGQGEIVGILGMYEDITDRKKIEDELAREKEQLDVTMRSIADAVITTDARSKILLFNKAAEDLTGWSAGEVIGCYMTDIFKIRNTEDRSILKWPIQEIMKRRRTYHSAGAVLLQTRNGEECRISFHASPIRHIEEEVDGAVFVLRDDQSREQAEDERLKHQKLESLGILAGGIAHDFNNMLTGILANISFVKQFPEAIDDLQEKLSDAEKACLQARTITDQLLTFAKGGEPVKKPTDIGRLLRNAVRLSLMGTRIKAGFDIQDNLPAAEVDESQINQVINNIVINAVQAMEEGGTIEIAAKAAVETEPSPSAPAGSYLEIAISDHGPGIERSQLKKIFDPYYTTKAGGSGLGLSTCYSIIKRHNGYIAVDSEENLGTTFRIFLPVSKRKIETPTKAQAQRYHGSGDILIMDDDSNIVRIMEAMLSRMGFSVEAVSRGEQAIEMLKASREDGKRYDLIILDLTIPGGLGGKETLGKLREIDPDLRAIVSSGYSRDPVIANYKKFGFDGFIKKPFSYSELSTALYHVFDPH